MLEKLDIRMCNIDDQGALAIIPALIHLTNFEALNMSSNRLITAAGWTSCFRLLLYSEFSLKELILNSNNVDDEGAELLINSLAHTPLKTWEMEGNEAVTAAGWIACFRILLDSESSWENFSLGGNSIDDEGVARLVSLLASTSTVRSLKLSSNASITTHGWRSFADVLRPTSSSKLRELCIGTYEQAAINDDAIVFIASAIQNNNSLEVFMSSMNLRYQSSVGVHWRVPYVTIQASPIFATTPTIPCTRVMMTQDIMMTCHAVVLSLLCWK